MMSPAHADIFKWEHFFAEVIKGETPVTPASAVVVPPR